MIPISHYYDKSTGIGYTVIAGHTADEIDAHAGHPNDDEFYSTPEGILYDVAYALHNGHDVEIGHAYTVLAYGAEWHCIVQNEPKPYIGIWWAAEENAPQAM